VLLVVALVAAGCGKSAPKTCDEVADETIELTQQFIDNVEAEVGDMTIEELLATQGSLPAIDDFAKRSKVIDEHAAALGCTQSELRTLVVDRVGRLHAQTPVGRLIIDGIATGGL